MDTLEFHYDESIFWKHDDSFMDPSVSWINKYKSNTDLTPRFFGSTTFLVFITDGWHLAQFFFLNTFFIALILYSPVVIISNWWMNMILNFLLLRSVFGIGFTLFYDYLLISKK